MESRFKNEESRRQTQTDAFDRIVRTLTGRSIDDDYDDYDSDYVAVIAERVDNGRPAFTNVHAVA